MNTSELSAGTQGRLRRIMQLQNCDEKTALEFAISSGWMAAERLRRLRGKLKSNGTDEK